MNKEELEICRNVIKSYYTGPSDFELESIQALEKAIRKYDRSLESKIREFLSELNIEFVSLRYHGCFKVHLLYKSKNQGYCVIKSEADSNYSWKINELNDWLYNELIQEFYKKESEK